MVPVGIPGVQWRDGNVPLLWQHSASDPVGEVLSIRPTNDGVHFKAKLPRLTDPSPLRDVIEKAWAALKARFRTVADRLAALDASVDTLVLATLNRKQIDGTDAAEWCHPPGC